MGYEIDLFFFNLVFDEEYIECNLSRFKKYVD